MKSRKSKIKRERKIIFNKSLITSEKFIENKKFEYSLLNNVNYIKNLFNNINYNRYDWDNHKEIYKDIIKRLIKLRISLGNNFYLSLFTSNDNEIWILPRTEKEYQRKIYVGKFIKHRLHRTERFYICDYVDVFETGLYDYE